MRISELARSTGVSLPTVKYYLREGLLPAGRPTAATQAEYDPSHAARLRLIRALVDVGGLSLSAVRSVLDALDSGPDQIGDAIGQAHGAISAAPEGAQEPRRALEAMASLGWSIHPRSPALWQLDAALAAAEEVGIPSSEVRVRTYAQAALEVADLDIAEIPSGDAPEDAAAAVAFVVLGTVLYEPVLLALRRLAQQHVYATRNLGVSDPAGRGSAAPPRPDR
jgi:DNA-binding transcriptional MerR regulator